MITERSLPLKRINRFSYHLKELGKKEYHSIEYKDVTDFKYLFENLTSAFN